VPAIFDFDQRNQQISFGRLIERYLKGRAASDAGRAPLSKFGSCDDRRKGLSVLAGPEATSKKASRKSDHCHRLNLVHAV
jgi:hypothetical protein